MNNPSITSVSYNANSGVLTVNGTNLASTITRGDLTLYGYNQTTGSVVNPVSFTLTKHDTVSYLNTGGFSVTLSSSDLSRVGNLFPLNGNQYVYGGVDYPYQLYAAAGWDGAGSPPIYYTGPLSVSGVDTLAAAHYTSGLTLKDTQSVKPFSNLTLSDKDPSDQVSAKLTLTAANGVLQGAGAGTSSGTTESYTLAATTPSALAKELHEVRFIPALHEVAGGGSVSNKLTLNISGSVSSQDLLTITQTETIKSTAPGFEKVNYDAEHGVLTVSGTGLHKNLVLSDFSVTAGKSSYTLTGVGDSIVKFSAHGFSLQLSSAEDAAVNAVYAANGSGGAKSPYTLAAAAGWDGAGAPAESTAATANYLTLSLKGLNAKSVGLNDTQTTQPFSHVVVADTYLGAQDTASVSFTAANGTLSGTGLSPAAVSNGTASYTLAAASPALLQQELRGLTFTPTQGQAEAGQSVTTSLTLTVSDDAHGNAARNSIRGNVSLSVRGSLPAAAAAINSASYNAVGGILTVTGVSIGSSLDLSKLTLSNGAGAYTLGTGDSVTGVTATGFNVQLGANGESAANALFTTNGVGKGEYMLTAQAGWDGAKSAAASAGLSASHSSIAVAGATPLTVQDFASVQPLAGITVSDSRSETLTANISYTGFYGSLSGSGLSGAAGNYTLTASSAAALQAELRALTFSPAISLDSTAPHTFSCPITVAVAGSSAALDTTAQAPLLEKLSINLPQGPSLASINYDAGKGVLTVTGANLVNGLTPSDITLNAGGAYTLSGAGDSVSNMSAAGFTLTLGGADKAAVNSLFNLNGASDSAGDAYTLSVSANWDGPGSPANTDSPLAVNVSNASGIIAGGLTAASVSDATVLSPFANINLTDTYPGQNYSVSISYASGDGVLSGGGLSAAAAAGGVVSYNLAAGTAAQLQTELQNLDFTPTQGETATTNFSLHFTGQSYPISTTPALTLKSGLNNPVAVAVNAAGDIFAASNGAPDGKLGHGELSAYSASGALLFQITTGISLPSSLAVDSAGNVYVTNYNINANGAGSVAEYSAAGALLQTFTGMTDVQSVAVDSQGDVFVACLDGNIQGGGFVEEFSASGALMQVITQGIQNPAALTLDSQGNVYIVNIANSGNNNNVEEFSPAGSLLQTFSDGLEHPINLAVDSYGEVYVGNALPNSGYVSEFDANGNLLFTDNASSAMQNPAALAVDSRGDVFVADNSSAQSVYEYSNTGALLATIKTGIGNPDSLYVDSAGNLYVSNSSNNTLEKFTPAGNGSVTDNYSATLTLNVTAGATSFNVAPNSDLSNLTVINNAAAGDKITIADAASFTASPVTGDMVTAAGGDPTQLAGWVAGALSADSGDLAANGLTWFQFNGNTYLVEQASTDGTAYGAGDTLVELVGLHDESHAVLTNGGVLTL